MRGPSLPRKLAGSLVTLEPGTNEIMETGLDTSAPLHCLGLIIKGLNTSLVE